jgi:hypothetical protein
MIGYVVPILYILMVTIVIPNYPYPINIASQKNFIALYHMGYTDSELLKWFTDEFPKTLQSKTGYGKSCIRFKKNRSNPISLDA